VFQQSPSRTPQFTALSQTTTGYHFQRYAASSTLLRRRSTYRNRRDHEPTSRRHQRSIRAINQGRTKTPTTKVTFSKTNYRIPRHDIRKRHSKYSTIKTGSI